MKFNLNINVFENVKSEVPIPFVLADFETSDHLKEVSDSVFTVIEYAADNHSFTGFPFLGNDEIEVNGNYLAKWNNCQIFFFKKGDDESIVLAAGVFSIECLTHVNVILFNENTDNDSSLNDLFKNDARALIRAIIGIAPLCYMQMIEKFKGVANDD